MSKLQSDCAIVFVHDSHDAYRWVRKALAHTGLSIMWVREPADAVDLARTGEVSLVICDSRNAGRDTRACLNELFRLAPRTRQLMISLPEQTGEDSPIGDALADAVPARTLRGNRAGIRPAHTGLALH